MSDRLHIRPRRPQRRSGPNWIIAAAVAVVAAIVGLFLFKPHSAQPPAEKAAVTALPSPATETASLVATQSPQAAFDEAKAENSVQAWDDFLSKVESGAVQAGPLANQARLERAKLLAAQNTQPAFDDAKSANTLQAWDDFLSRVDSGELARGAIADQARKERAKLVATENTKIAFNQAKTTNTVEAWDEFLAGTNSGEYQAESFAEQARRERAKLAGQNGQPEFDEARRIATIEAWDDFLAKVKSGEINGGILADRARRERSLLLVSQLQSELRRVGCDPGQPTADWRDGSRRALDAYNINASTSFDTSNASVEALRSVQGQSARVCPLICDRGRHVEGDACVAGTAPAPAPEKAACDPANGEDCDKEAVKDDAEKPAPATTPESHTRGRHHAERAHTRSASGGRQGGRKCMLFSTPHQC